MILYQFIITATHEARMAEFPAMTKLSGDIDKTTPFGPASRGSQNDETQQFDWDIATINVHLEGIREFWANELGISGPQWMILMATGDLDRGLGVPVKDVSSMLHVDPSFVSTQSKMLERNGFMRCSRSQENPRLFLISLSDKAARAWRCCRDARRAALFGS